MNYRKAETLFNNFSKTNQRGKDLISKIQSVVTNVNGKTNFCSNKYILFCWNNFRQFNFLPKYDIWWISLLHVCYKKWGLCIVAFLIYYFLIWSFLQWAQGGKLGFPFLLFYHLNNSIRQIKLREWLVQNNLVDFMTSRSKNLAFRPRPYHTDSPHSVS